MAMSVSELAPGVGAPPGPRQPFQIHPDDASRRMLGRWFRAYGDLCRVPGANDKPATWIVHDPGLIQQVLVRNHANYCKGAGLDRVKLLLGNGIMVSEGDFWARQRRMVQPLFRPRALSDFNAMIVEENRALAQRWRALAGNEPVEILSQTSELTLVIVLKSIFGIDYAHLTAAGDSPFALLTEQPERNLKFAARFHRLTGVVGDIVDRRLAEGRVEGDFLGRLMVARHGDERTPMTRKALVDEVMTLIVAGHETTASALAWAWALLATHPRVLARLQAEVDTVDESVLRTRGANAKAGLRYTEQVIKETLRLYPPGWLLSRRAIAADRLGDYPIEVGIEAGAQIFICPYVVHRHPGYWREPERFDPSRFERAGEPGHRFAYIPFAAGPRHCVGEPLAMTEMITHLALLARRFTPRYLAQAAPRITSRINLRPCEAIPMQMTPRG